MSSKPRPTKRGTRKDSRAYKKMVAGNQLIERLTLGIFPSDPGSVREYWENGKLVYRNPKLGKSHA